MIKNECESRVSVKSVKKAFDALDLIVSESILRDGLPLKEIAEKLGIKNTTAHNILKTMEFCGYIARTGKLYSPGYKCQNFSKVHCNELVNKAKPLLIELAKKTGESFVLTALVNAERKVLFRVKGDSIIVVEPDLADNKASIASLVTSRTMLVFANEMERRLFAVKYLGGDEESKAKFIKQLQNDSKKIEETGFIEAVNGELASAAVPFLNKNLAFICAIGIYAPVFRFSTKKRKQIISELKDVARQISL